MTDLLTIGTHVYVRPVTPARPSYTGQITSVVRVDGETDYWVAPDAAYGAKAGTQWLAKGYDTKIT